MINFKIAIEKLLRNEGGYVNDPDDPGGETNFGICKRSFPELDIRNLTESDAKNIYRVNYWNVLRCDEIKRRDLARQIFDFGVNAGVSKSTETIQKLLGDVRIDGKMGRKTIASINSFKGGDLFLMFILSRIRFYMKLARKTHMRKFLYAWIKRTIE